MKTRITYKKALIIFIIGYVFFNLLLPGVIEFVMQRMRIEPYILIIVFVGIIGLTFLIIGIYGLVTGKHYSLSSEFADKYEVGNGQIQTEMIEHHGFLGIARSIISIIIGIAILTIEGFVLYFVVFQK